MSKKQKSGGGSYEKIVIMNEKQNKIMKYLNIF